MTQRVSFSRVECWRECPAKYRYRYIDKIKPEQDFSASNPLILGKALDTGIEQGVQAGLEYYHSQFPVITDDQVNWAMQLEYWIPKLQAKFNSGEFQMKLESDRFIGYMDYIEGNLIVDFKYSNHTEKYAKSPQLSIYASEYGKTDAYLAYVCIPKSFIRQKKDEDLHAFRKRLTAELDKLEVQVVWVDYDEEAVDAFWTDADRMLNDSVLKATPNENCKYCEYAAMCQSPIEVDAAERLKPKVKVKPRSELKLC